MIKTVGEVVRKGRHKKYWTIRDLAENSGVSSAMISQIENGDVIHPGLFTTRRLLHALGLRLEAVEDCNEGAVHKAGCFAMDTSYYGDDACHCEPLKSKGQRGRPRKSRNG